MSNANTTQPSHLAHRLTANVKLLHKAALVSNNQVLILKRSNQAVSRPGKWDLPGGNSEWPVALQDNAKNIHQEDVAREIKEETSLSVPASNFLVHNLVYFATYFNADKQIYSVNCGWQVKDVIQQDQTQVEISSEHTDYRWISLSELTDYDFGPEDRDFEITTIQRAFK